MPGVGPWLHALEQTTHHQGQAIFQQQVIHSDGHSSPLEISVRHLHRLGRDHLICVGRNNSAQLLLAERLQRLSDHDGLTGLYNRRYFDETLTTEWRRLSREKTPLGLLMIDVDHFKSFNDHLGHQAGDDALKKLATALDDNLMREGDCVCRYGGEEFAVILPGADEKQCLKVARRLHDAIAELNIRHPDSPHPKGLLTISIGAASLMPMPQRNPQDLIKQADDALYRAKHAGRDRTCLAEQE
jgi:diguanylate cyclase (GGDEF)-like protein